MYSIGEFAKKFKTTSRTLRLYESKGLLHPSYRGQNGYRFYQNEQAEALSKIQNLKDLGFSLEEIKELKNISHSQISEQLTRRLASLEEEISKLLSSKEKLQDLLSVSKKVMSGSEINPNERRIFMDGIKQEVLNKLSQKVETISPKHLEFIERDQDLFNSPTKLAFIEAVKKCVKYAEERNLLLGPGRGSGPASILMYALGFSGIDPTQNGIIPERLIKDAPDLHIDVEFERGQGFVDFCREVSKDLSYGSINAFKMPLLNIIDNVEKRIEQSIDYDSVSDDILLKDIRSGDIEKIFCLDMSQEALVWKYENFLPGYEKRDKLKKYLESQKIYSFDDLLNIIALWRPNTKEKIERAELYKKRKQNNFRYEILSPTLQEHLKRNFGQIIYHEDLILVLKEYTNYDLNNCSRIRRDLFKQNLSQKEHSELKEILPDRVYELVVTEAPNTFCRSHLIAFSTFIKKTAILKALYRDIYFEEIEKWESQFGFKWDDIGIKIEGVSLLQN